MQLEILKGLISLLLGSAGAALIYKLGHKIGSVDIPNERSSHSIPTPRGGGIGVWLAFIVVGIFFSKEQFFVVTAGVVGLVGLLEDRFTLMPKIRLLVQVIFSAIAVQLFFGLPTSVIEIMLFLFWIVFITGTANFYNFMDGIDGIAGLTGIVGFGLMAFFAFTAANESDVSLMSLVLFVGCLGFLPFNFPKAKVFMGDVGSVFLGFVFASFTAKISTDLSAFLCIVMFLCMFYADALVTLFYRWGNGERLMKAHRSHLYQYMSNELRLPHWEVSLLYAFMQFVFGLSALLVYRKGLVWQLGVFVIFGIIFSVTYRYVKNIKPSMTSPQIKELST